MRDPDKINKVEYNGDSLSIITIGEIPEFDIEDYDLFDQKEFNKYINDIEKKIVRQSFEYRQYTKFLRENMDMNKCSFYENVNNIDTFKIKIHIHHEPFNLFELCLIVYNKRVFYNEDLDAEMVAKEVMYLHYKLLVGLIPLSETVHELVHNNYLFVPLQKVMGNINFFIDAYHDFIPPDLLELLDKNKEYSDRYHDAIEENILHKEYVYLDVSGSYSLPNYEELVQIMNDKIREMKDNKGQQLVCPVAFDIPSNK